jgi:hypothetical protein
MPNAEKAPVGFKRIDPADAPRLFRSLGLTPVADYWHKDGCTCLGIALAAEKSRSALSIAARWQAKGIRNGDAASKIAGELGFESDYVLGLIYGWDGRDMGPRHPLHTDAYHELTTAGFADGQAAREACERAGLAVAGFDEPAPANAP